MNQRERIDSMLNLHFGYGIKNYDFDRYFTQQKRNDLIDHTVGQLPQNLFNLSNKQSTQTTRAYTPFQTQKPDQLNNQFIQKSLPGNDDAPLNLKNPQKYQSMLLMKKSKSTSVLTRNVKGNMYAFKNTQMGQLKHDGFRRSTTLFRDEQEIYKDN